MTVVDASYITFHPFVSRENESAFFLRLPTIDFQYDSQFRFQPQAAIQAQRLKFEFESIYLDAAAITSGTTYLDIATTQQTVSILAGFQGYRPLLINPGSEVFTFRNPGANGAGGSQQLNVFFLNVPVIGTSWGVVAGSGTGAGAAVWG